MCIFPLDVDIGNKVAKSTLLAPAPKPLLARAFERLFCSVNLLYLAHLTSAGKSLWTVSNGFWQFFPSKEKGYAVRNLRSIGIFDIEDPPCCLQTLPLPFYTRNAVVLFYFRMVHSTELFVELVNRVMMSLKQICGICFKKDITSWIAGVAAVFESFLSVMWWRRNNPNTCGYLKVTLLHIAQTHESETKTNEYMFTFN